MANIQGFHMTFPGENGIFFTSKEQFLKHLEQLIDRHERGGAIKYFGATIRTIATDNK